MDALPSIVARVVCDHRTTRDNDGHPRRELEVAVFYDGSPEGVASPAPDERWMVVVFDHRAEVGEIGVRSRRDEITHLVESASLPFAIGPIGTRTRLEHLNERDPVFLAVCKALRDEAGLSHLSWAAMAIQQGHTKTGIVKSTIERRITDLLGAGLKE